MFRNKQSVHLIDTIGNICTFGGLVCFVIYIFLIVDLINNFNINYLLFFIIYSTGIIVGGYGYFILIREYQSIKIISINNQTIITHFVNHKKEKLVLNNADIKNFNVYFDLSDCGVGSVYYYMKIQIKTNTNCYEISYSFSSKSIIKSIFKIAKYIPNFSYTISVDSFAEAKEDINKIARDGNGLNLVEYLKFMLINKEVSGFGRIETYINILCFTLLILMIILMFLDIHIVWIPFIIYVIVFLSIIKIITYLISYKKL